jgi:spore germination protein PC
VSARKLLEIEVRNMFSSYQHYVQYLHMIEQRLKSLESRQVQLETENGLLKEKLESIKPIHIENINYKIQELAVKELKGTLNIGLSALTDAEQINKLIQGQSRDEGIQFENMTHPQDSDPSS